MLGIRCVHTPALEDDSVHSSKSLAKGMPEVRVHEELEACQATSALHFCCLQKLASDNAKLWHEFKEKAGCCDALMESILKEKASNQQPLLSAQIL